MFYHMTEAQVIIFGLIFLRMISFVVSSVVFGSGNISVPIKILLAVVVSMVVFPSVQLATTDAAKLTEDLVLLSAREVAVGLSLGFLTRLFFFTVGMAGELVSVTIGLGQAQIYNPMLGSNSNTVEQFYNTLATLIFFAINGHHLVLGGIAQSYELIPLAQMKFNVGPFAEMATFVQDMMVMGIKMCAPVIGAVLVTNIAMGILGRAVPQINVLVTSVPVTLLIGFVLMFICIPLLVMEMHGIMDLTHTKLVLVMKALAF
ncbi:flagellar biosynthetic protein FliR [Bdellovibrio sp. HCB337]|uniref:flagellar biosynthetic protein FliR n=1 Tax=Bdellovibrio sp. HCB337 TaxID=3394358 RepID=UPI0039A47403